MSEPRPRLLAELQGPELPPFTPVIVYWVKWSIDRLPRDNPKVLTDTFYRLLFELAPHTRGLFADNMDPQKDRLFGALIAAAKGLERPERLEPALRRWGNTHRRQHGITDEMYVYVGQALVRTLTELLGCMDSLVQSSWVAVYQWLAAVMIDGADAAQIVDQNPSSLWEIQPEEDVTNVMVPAFADAEGTVTLIRPRGARAEAAARRRAAGG
jgi:hemoglobin-like flavoprotein